MSVVLALGIAVAAGVAGFALTGVLVRAAGPERPPVGDRVQAAADALRDGRHVYVTDDGRSLVGADDERRLESLADASPNPVYVVVWADAHGEAGYYLDYDAVDQLQRLVDEDAVWVVYSGPGDGLVSEGDGIDLDPSPPDDFRGDGVRRITETLTAVAAADPDSEDYHYDYWGGTGGAIAAGLLFACGAIPALLVLIGIGRMLLGRPWRMRGGWT